ncbi:MAG: membrane protein insertase YidC, partial [Rhodoferax sp.]|nr:membrane protein insertase YidC [Rhodoferax sp.]
MNDIRRTILWVIFGFSLVMLWDQWQVYNGRKPTFFPSAVQRTASAPQPTGAASTPDGVPKAINNAATGAGIASVTGQKALQNNAPAVAHERVVVHTDVFKLTFDTEGGSLVQVELLKHADMADKARPFVLLDDSKDRVYLAQTGLIPAAGGSALPTHKSVMTLMPGERTLAEGSQTLELRFESADVGGVKLVKTYTLTRGSYAVAVKHEVINLGATAVSPQLYLQLVRDGNKPVGESSFYSTFTGPAIYTEAKKYQKVEFADIEKGKVDIEKTATNGYVAMVQHYFASAWLLADGMQRDLFMRKVDTNLYSVGMIAPLESIAPGARKTVEAKL